MKGSNAQFVTIEMEDGSELLMETIPHAGQQDNAMIEAGRGSDVKIKLSELGEKIMKPVKAVVGEVKNGLKDMAPDEIQLDFSIGLSESAGVILASAAMTQGLTVRLKWSNKKSGGQ